MKILLSLISILFSFCCLAQSDSASPAKKPKWGISVVYNSVEAQIDQQLMNTWVFPAINYYDNFGDKKNKSYSLSILPEYSINEDMFLRFELGMTNINLLSHFNGYHDSVSTGFSVNTIADDTLQQKIYRFSPGIQLNFMKMKFIEAYCGGMLNYFHYSEITWVQNIKSNDIPGRGTIYRSTTPGGFAAGIGAFSGFNIYLNKKIAIGGEISYSLLYYKLGGTESGMTISTFPTSPTETAIWSVENNKSGGVQFSKIMPSFHLTIKL